MRCFGERVTVIDGNSWGSTIPAYIQAHPNARCSLVVVDGDHSYVGTLLDLASLLQMAACDAPVLLDDVCKRSSCHAQWCHHWRRAAVQAALFC